MLAQGRSSKAYLLATILMIGDSHTYQSFGRNVDSLLRTIPESKVVTVASWGTSPAGWFTSGPYTSPFFMNDTAGAVTDLPKAPTPVYAELLKKYKPNLTIIALGANLFKAPLEHSAKTVHEMAQMTGLSNSACIWIGPPDSRERSGREMDELYGVLRGASTPYCKFVDSRQWTNYPDNGGDGLHYDYLGEEGLKQTKNWANKIYELVFKILG